MSFFSRYGYGWTLLLATVMITAGAGAAVGQTDITSKFKDANFRAAVYKSIGKKAPAAILDRDVSGITVLNVSRESISDLSGIEYFTALKELYCIGNELTALDVSKNTALTWLHCGDNQLTALNVSKNTALTWLNCYQNQLTALDVSKNTALMLLNCYQNQLTALDMSENTALTSLNCSDNQLTVLNVSKSTALTSLDCRYNQLTVLNVSKNTALTRLNCSGNQLTVLNVSKNTALTSLDCEWNRLTALDVSENTALERLYCEGNIFGNQLTELNVSENTALMELNCSYNQLTALNVSKSTALRVLDCNGNRLIALNVSENTALTWLDCSMNQLTALNVSKNTALTKLKVSGNYFSYESDIIGLNKLNLTEFIINPQFTIITFNTSGGSAVPSQTKLGALGSIKASKPADPTRSGYLFGGWYKEVTCTGSAWNFNDAVIPNMTLYAKWIELGDDAPNRPLNVVADFNQRAELNGKNKQVVLKWRYFTPIVTNGRFYVYRRETQPSSGAWSLFNNFIDAEKSESVLSTSFVDDGIALNKSYEYRIVFVEGTVAPNAATPPASNGENITVNTYLPSGTPGTTAYIPYNKTSDTYVVENVTYKDIYGTNPRDLSGKDYELFRHLLSGYQLSSGGDTHLSRWSDMGKLVVPLDADASGLLVGARTILNTRKSARPVATARMTAGRLCSDQSVAAAAANMLAEFNERGGYSISNYAPVGPVPNALSSLSGTKSPVFWVLDRYLVHGNDVNDDRNAGTADYAYYGAGLIFHDLRVSYLETGSPFFSAVSNLPGFNENFNGTIAGFRYKFGTIQDAMVGGATNKNEDPMDYMQTIGLSGSVTVGNEVSTLSSYEMAEMRGVGSSTSNSHTIGESVEVEIGTKFTLGGQSLGVSVEFEERLKVGAMYGLTNEHSSSTSHEYTTAEIFQRANSRDTSKEVKKDFTNSMSVTVPPHTQVMLRQGPASIEMSIDYDYPVVISYKVTVVALGSRRNGGAASGFIRPVVTYGIDTTSENRATALEIDAAENFKVLWAYRNDHDNSKWHSADTVSLNRVWTQMKQATGAVSNFSLLGFENNFGSKSEDALVTDYIRPIAVGMTDVKPMTVVRSTVKHKSESMNSELYPFQPIYPLDRIETIGLDSISLINGSRYYVDKENIPLTAKNNKGVDYYGFRKDKGGWALTDAAGNPHDGSIARLTPEAGTGRSTIVADGNNTGVVYLRYIIDNNVYRCGECTRYITASDLGTRTAIIPIYVKSAGSLGIKEQPQGGTATVSSSASYPLAVEAVATGTVSYQWYVSAVPSTAGGSPISGATGPTYNAPLGTVGVFYYYVVVSVNDPSVEPVKSMLATVRVEPEPESGKVAVTFSAGTNGVIGATVDGIPIAYGASVQQGKSIVFIAVPDAGYDVSGWTINGIPVAGNTDTKYTLTNVSAAATVTVSFSKTISVASPDRVVPAVRPDGDMAAIVPVSPLITEFTVGPNPVGRSFGKVNFFRKGSRVAYATLSIYDASGKIVRKIRVIDDAVGSQTRRKVSSWNLRDDKGRLVADGTYLVKGVVKTSDGKRERVDMVVGVR
jgi:uncharacterized repeat protein (TIGR02543 family)